MKAEVHVAQLAQEMWRLYVVNGTYWYSQMSTGGYRYKERPLSLSDLHAHLLGDVTVGIPSTWKGQGKFLNIDVDSLDDENLAREVASLRELGVPHLISFSGNKGYHASMFVKQSHARNVARAAPLLERLLGQLGVTFDQIVPTGSGLSGSTPGGPNVKLPLGRHRMTGSICHPLDEDLRPVADGLSLLRSLEPIDVQELIGIVADKVGLDLKTGELIESWDSRYPWELHGYRPCVNVLWQEGLQEPGTRHSATMVIINAVLRSRDIRDELKEQAVVDWVRRMYPMARQNGYIDESTGLEFAESEARRLYKREAKNSNYGVTCRNSVLRDAMESACRDEVACHTKRNRSTGGFVLLTRLAVFNPRNSHRKGIAKSAGYVYLALQELADEFGGKNFVYHGMPAFAAPRSMIEELASCSQSTVKGSLKALRHVGLAVKVPKRAVPEQFRRKRLPGQGYTLQASYYVLPELTDKLVRGVVAKAREYRTGR